MNGLKVKNSKIQGKGLFADKEFNEGDLIGIAHINGNPTGMIGRFHNHSDNPNAHSISIGNKKYLAALRPLMKGEEITVDYRRQPDLEQPEQFQNGGSSGDKFKKRLMKRNPGMQGVYGPEGENLNIVKDPNYDARSYGYGDIEFMAPGLEQVNYENKIDKTLPGYTYVNPSPDKYTSIYNPRGANRADIFLDMMHGMRDDQNYEPLLQNFDKAVRDARGGDMQYYYEKDVAKGYTDSQEQWDENYVDGQLRAQLAPGTLGMFSHGRRDYRKERRHDSPEMKAAAKDIRNYLKGEYQKGGAYYDDSRDAWVYADGTVGPNGPAYYKKGGEPKNRKLKLRKGDYDPQNEAGYIQETPDVNVVDPTIWGKYGRKYEENVSEEDFVNKKKKQYLALHPGLTKKSGLTMDYFPADVEQNFRDAYDYNKHTAMVKGVAKEEGWNPKQRDTYVDDLNAQGTRIISDSKYGSKLQPNTWSRSLAGLQELGNTVLPGQPFKYNIPGLTKAEQKQMREDPTSALEIFAPANTLGQITANAAKNRGLSYGSDYKELPGFASGEFMPNVDDSDAAGLDPIQMALGIYSGAQLPALATKLPGLITKGAKSAANTAQGIYDAGTDIKGIYNAGKGSNLSFATAPEAQAARALQEAGILGKNIDPKVLGRFPGLGQSTARQALKNYNTTYRAVTPDITNASIDELMNMAKSGVTNFDDPVEVAQYMSTHIPMESYGYRANPLTPGVNQDLLYTAKYPNAETAAEKLRQYGTYLTEVRPSMDFSTGDAKDWFSKYYTDKPFGIDRSGEIVSKFKNEGNGLTGYKPGTIAAKRDYTYLPYIGQKGEKVLEPIRTIELKPKTFSGIRKGKFQDGGEPKRKKYRFIKDTEEAKQFPADEWGQYIQEEPEVVVRPLTPEQQQARNMEWARMEMARRNPHLYLPDGTLRPQAAQSADWVWQLGAMGPAGLEGLGAFAAKQIPRTGLTVGTVANTAAGIHGATQVPQRIQDWQDVAAGKKDWREAAAESLMTGLELYGGYDAAKTLLPQTYKINPWALKENPEMYLYRTQPKDFVAGLTEEEHLKNLITDKIIKGEEVPWHLKGKLHKMQIAPEPFREALNKYHGQWFDKNPARMEWYMKSRLDDEVGDILRLKVPKSEGDAFNLKNFPEAQKASLNYESEFIVPRERLGQAEKFSTEDLKRLMQEDATFNKPHWLKGYKGVPKQLPGSPNNFSIFPKDPTPIEGIDISKGRASKTINPAKEIYIDPKTGLKRRGDTIYLGAEWGPKYRGRYNNSKYADPALLEESMQPYLLPEDQLRLRYPWMYE